MFNYLIVGAGSAGCVLANRLSENPNNRVCLLEAGGSDKHPMVYTPAGVIGLMTSPRFNWRFNSVPQSSQDGRQIYCPRGKTLGGSSSVNAMLYIRGQKEDYDHWASLGNLGWSWDEVLPYFKRSQHQERGPSDLHGVGGPLNVSDLQDVHPLSTRFVTAAMQVGHGFSPDFNGHDQEGVGYYQGTRKNGQRCSAAAAYLHPVMERPNLTVITGARTTRICVEQGRATGVEYIKDGVSCYAQASDEVILSAGSLQSPQLLMLSGIGPKAELEPLGIEVVHELAGVGQNLQEHVDVLVVNQDLSRSAVSMAVPMGLMRSVADLANYLLKHRGPLASTVVESGGFIKSSPELETPDLQLQFMPVAVDDHGRNRGMMFKYGLSIHVCVLRPQSRGRVGLNSASPLDDPLIDLNMLASKEDMQRMVAGVRKIREILQAPDFKGVVGPEIFPGNELQSDQQLEAFLRDKANHVYHPVGTCKMGRDEMAVVDEQLCVHGLDNLRVVDASVMPTLISGNTNAPTIMIGEKAADMILAKASSGC